MNRTRNHIVAGVAFVGLALSVGCASSESGQQTCEVPGVGSGVCCNLELAGSTALGACIDGMCTNGRDRQFDPTCGPRQPGDDFGIQPPP
ncbi:MAG: hypothetical protein KC583_15520, partial [Myxococcales bacterium]|nr:hypothetical protein [Myxococcales bacterium]